MGLLLLIIVIIIVVVYIKNQEEGKSWTVPSYSQPSQTQNNEQENLFKYYDPNKDIFHICPKCEHSISDGDLTCPSCGFKVSVLHNKTFSEEDIQYAQSIVEKNRFGLYDTDYIKREKTTMLMEAARFDNLEAIYEVGKYYYSISKTGNEYEALPYFFTVAKAGNIDAISDAAKCLYRNYKLELAYYAVAWARGYINQMTEDRTLFVLKIFSSKDSLRDYEAFHLKHAEEGYGPSMMNLAWYYKSIDEKDKAAEWCRKYCAQLPSLEADSIQKGFLRDLFGVTYSTQSDTTSKPSPYVEAWINAPTTGDYFVPLASDWGSDPQTCSQDFEVCRSCIHKSTRAAGGEACVRYGNRVQKA